ncbi:ADP-ribosylation factor-like protein 10 isoform X1 [Choloepus didactylus]|uniref:ADP-ribosylation factor-like protein 10 isoform X1 n=1 Tax=Choloepus didactylus TaxID=27675 RepID=UPI0018A06113|nr:ADP-ribosylation factor-like protein 10 isoform X1 [Choloepus didactylus]
MAPRPLGPLVLALGGAAALLGSVLFILWKAYCGRSRERRWDQGEAWWGAEPAGLPEWDEWDLEDEEDEEPVLEELEQREVLVLGLDGSGKSTFLRVLSGKPPLEGHVPTWGFNSVRLPTKNFEVDLLEISGSQNLRFYWKEFVNEVDVLVFVVDSSDHLRLPRARRELHKLLAKDPDLPVVIVANKQDLNGAMSVVELQRELGLQAVHSQREVFLLAASIAPAGPGFGNPGTVHIWKLLLELLS